MTAVNPLITREQARDVVCPLCGARPHHRCRAMADGVNRYGPFYAGAEIVSVHVSRLQAARRAQTLRRLGQKP